MKWNSRILFFLCVLFVACSAPDKPLKRVLLHDNWKFSNLDTIEWQSAIVPGVVQTDLLNHNRIPDPWIGTNENRIQWVEEQSWVYTSQFQLSKNEIEYQNINIVFEGLDTYAEVHINNIKILWAENMFRTWRVDVKKHLQVGENQIRIVFHSPLAINKPKLDSLGYALPAGGETVTYQVSPFTRKAPYHFGWDWGPRIVTAGIWRPVYLQLWDNARLENVQIVQEQLKESVAIMKANVTVVADVEEIFQLRVFGQDTILRLTPGKYVVPINFTIDTPKLWWPNGWGAPNLYTIPVQLLHKDEIVDELNESVGLRSVGLVQEKDSIGESFYFKVNGEPIFAKGANYIPQSHFLPNVTLENYKQLIESCKAANINMLRVWGGGIYENDEFYQLCDENGIMIWQDFMFAGSMYPGDSVFLNNVGAEIEDNVKRLRNHPSVVLWNGNNEIEVAWNNWGWQDKFGYSATDSAKIWNDYLKIFNDLIPDKLEKLDPDRYYTSTSPLSNWGKPEFYNKGSMHYWGVWHGPDNFDGYSNNVGRFMSEYGFQSFPNMETIQFFSDSSDWGLNSVVMKHHQKSYVGNGMIKKHMDKYFSAPISFEDFVFKNQATQAKAMQIAIDAHRVNKGHCWGTLFWQLNDCWPGPSWSSIDVFGRKKLLFHELEMLYAPVALIPQLKENTLHVTLVNDLLENFDGNMRLTLKSDERVVWTSIKKVSCTSNSVNEVYQMHKNKVLDGQDGDSIILEIKLEQEGNAIYQRDFQF